MPGFPGLWHVQILKIPEPHLFIPERIFCSDGIQETCYAAHSLTLPS